MERQKVHTPPYVKARREERQKYGDDIVEALETLSNDDWQDVQQFARNIREDE